MSFTRQQLKIIRAENRTWPERLKEIPEAEWPQGLANDFGSGSKLLRALRSRDFFVMLWLEPSNFQRLSIQRTDFVGAGKRAKDGIDWDDIQRLKAEAGFATAWAVECYPAAGQVVDVANMRHVFIMPEAPDWAWKRSPRIVFVDGPVPIQPLATIS